MKFLSWRPSTTPNPNIIPFVWAGCRTGIPSAVANKVSEPLLKTPADKTLFLWQPVEGFLTKCTQRQLVNAPPPMDFYRGYFEKFFARLKANGVRFDNLIVDIEAFPAGERGDKLLTHAEFQAAKRNIATALRRAIYEPLNDPTVKMSDWENCVPKFWEVIDPHGWPYAPGDYSISGVTSWPLYPVQYGNFYWQNDFAHDVLWNSFITNLNNTLACSGGTQLPWIAYPTYTEKGQRKPANALRWIWNQQLKHLTALGISHCLLWNPERDDDAYVSRCLDELNGKNLQAPQPATTQGTPTKLPYDDDVVVTGTVETRYTDFVAALAGDGMEPNPKPRLGP